MAFSESILQRGVGLPLHDFVEAALQHFNVAPLKFTPNSFHIIVAFFIAFMEAGIGELNVDEFTYIYGIKALSHYEGFWYTAKRGAIEKGITGPHDNMGHWKDHFFFNLLSILESLGLYVSIDQYVALLFWPLSCFTKSSFL